MLSKTRVPHPSLPSCRLTLAVRERLSAAPTLVPCSDRAAAQAQQLSALRAQADGAARAQADAAMARSEALASLQVRPTRALRICFWN